MIPKDYLFVSTPQINYEIFLDKKVTYVLGDSATGKTTLFEYLQEYVQASDKDLEPYLCVSNKLEDYQTISRDLIETYLKETKNAQSSVVVYSRRLLKDVTAATLKYHADDIYESFLRESAGSILYCDENIITSPLFDTFLRNCITCKEDIKILVAGRLMCSCPYLDVASLQTLVYDKKHNINTNVNLYSTQKAPEKVNLVLVEDSSSGLEFYKMYFNKYNIPVYSINGKRNIFKILACLNFDKHFPYIICDGYSFANEFLKLDENLKDIRKFGFWAEDGDSTSRLFCYNCFEDIIVHSDWIKNGRLNFSDREAKVLDKFISGIEEDLPEKVSARLLNCILKFSCGGYSKKVTDKNCLTKPCKMPESKCKSCVCLGSEKCECYFCDDRKVENILLRFKDIFPNTVNADIVNLNSVILCDGFSGIIIDNEVTIFGKQNTTFVFDSINEMSAKISAAGFKELCSDETVYKFTWKTYERFHNKDSIQHKSFSLKESTSKNSKAKHMNL